MTHWRVELHSQTSDQAVILPASDAAYYASKGFLYQTFLHIVQGQIDRSGPCMTTLVVNLGVELDASSDWNNVTIPLLMDL